MRSEEVTTTESMTMTATENPVAMSRALRLERRMDGQLWARTGDQARFA